VAVTSPPAPAPTRPAGSKLRLWVVAAVIVGAVGFLLFRGLDSATLYFYRADEAVERRDALGDKRFRLQGAVVDGTVDETADGVSFDVRANRVSVDVVHQGDPPELFQPGIAVLLEGRWDGDHFASDRIIVKHSSEYEAEHPDRVPAGSP
jgi:cytochrome c-type biogenesis protein CcmE